MVEECASLRRQGPEECDSKGSPAANTILPSNCQVDRSLFAAIEGFQFGRFDPTGKSLLLV